MKAAAELGERSPSADCSKTETGRTQRATGRTRLQFGHLSSLDGARGLAIISVVLYHSGWSDRGLFGVDAFFVISGFLITLLLIREAVNHERVRLRSFYARRARRLLPPVIVTLGATLVLVWAFGTIGELKSAADTAVFSLLQIANWQQIGTDTAYWDAAGAIIPLGQMWSLSVTEQFYLVWPVLFALLWLAARRNIARLGVLVIALLVAASVVAPVLYDGTNADRLYLGTDARAVAFVAGALCACIVAWVLQRAPRWADDDAGLLPRIVITAISVTALTTTVASSVTITDYHDPWLYQGGLAIIALTIGIFVATLCIPANGLRRFFSWRPFRAVGVISYALFLVHMPVLWLVQTLNPGLSPLALFGIGLPVSAAVAWVLHHLWGEPLRTVGWSVTTALVAVTIGVAAVTTLALCLPALTPPAPSAPAADHSPQTSGTSSAFPVEGSVALPAKADGTPTTVAVIGDSVAGNMVESLANHYDGTRGPLSAIDITTGGCGIFDADSARSGEGYVMDTVTHCWPWQEKLEAATAEHAPDAYILHNLWDANDQLVNGRWVSPGDPEWAERYRTQLERLIEIARRTDAEPLILLSNDRPRDPNGSLSATRLAAVDAVADEIIAKYPHVARLDFREGVCPQGVCASTVADGSALYRDGAHFTVQGMTALAPWLVEQVAAGLAARGE